MTELHVATFNILHFADRWRERLALILADMAALDPDVLGLQEVVYPLEQDRVIGAAGETRYEIFRGPAERPEYGNSLLVRDAFPADAYDRVELGIGREAHRVRLALPDGPALVVAVTHLHHPPEAVAERDEQVARLVDWMASAPPAAGEVVVGDFNATPDEPAYARMVAAGFRSAYATVHGREPERTWPTGLARAIPDEGRPGCIDYVWVRGTVEPVSARLVFDRPAVGDPTLYPSDHVGVAARLRVG